ncbi:MAG: alpha/beta hydrolase [Flavobacteriaceae bacterium CG18_big_fil_WC_8_21_14_2_50_34_36]|nr:MAG: alpha/beta hydrolase [Flavobacteriaceae bacterium CG18_big_fil_WC_8_21_14_2_50_34_36]
MKNFLQKLIFVTSLVFFTVSCNSDSNDVVDDTPAPLEAAVFLNVSYGTNAQQIYDIYLPEGRTKENTKVIVLIHGGGWTAGDKANMNNFVVYLQENFPDYAIVNTNYVLAEIGIPAFPNQFLDLESVLFQIKSQEEELQIKAEFGLIGTSAGAHIALMYDYSYDVTNQVKFVADIVGPTDFLDPFYADDPNFAVALQALVDEGAYPEGTNFAEAVSPLHQVTAMSSPTILFYGNQDPLVPLSNGVNLEAALNNVGVLNSFTVYNGGHGDNWSAADFLDVQVKLRAFIQTHLPL